jgi:casein kinase II subunit alpha
VFEGIDMVNNDRCIIKVLKPVAAKKINREIKILRNLTGGPNVVALLDVVRDRSARYHSLIMEYVENVEWKVLFPKLTEADIKSYTFQLLKVNRPHTFPHGVFLIDPHERLWTLYIRMGSCIET